MRIAIAGAGIGGLAAAIALHRDGHQVTVYEQASQLSEIGAGIQLSPNASRVLAWLGVLDELVPLAVEPARGDLRRWEDGSVLVSQPLGNEVRERYGFPYLHAHRADLHGVLARAATDCDVRLGHRLDGFEPAGDGVRVRVADGAVSVDHDLLIGADGIHSAVRRELFGDESPRFSGNAVWRGLVDRRSIPDIDLPRHSHGFLGPGRHFVTYYVRSGRYVNWVGVAPSDTWDIESWTAPGRLDDARADFAGWCPTVATLIDAVGDAPIYRWALFDRDPLPRWSEGPVTLLGDACHPMLPFMAQGAAQAIEDAAVLAGCLRTTDEPAEAVVVYESLRRERTAKVQLAARANETMFHLPDGPEQRQRDERLGAADATTNHRNAWLFDYDAMHPSPAPAAD
ncbi:MAG: FAD-dependent monooxygenase [Actinomycetota bacterium]